MATAVSATSALGIAAAAAAGCSSQDTWLALLGPEIAPHTLEDTFPGILKVFAAAVSADGKTSLLSLMSPAVGRREEEGTQVNKLPKWEAFICFQKSAPGADDNRLT